VLTWLYVFMLLSVDKVMPNALKHDGPKQNVNTNESKHTKLLLAPFPLLSCSPFPICSLWLSSSHHILPSVVLKYAPISSLPSRPWLIFPSQLALLSSGPLLFPSPILPLAPAVIGIKEHTTSDIPPELAHMTDPEAGAKEDAKARKAGAEDLGKQSRTEEPAG
jgi:hypothetical protein